MDKGQVYIEVKADVVSPMLMSVNGSEGSVVGGSLTLSWSRPGGITDVHGWKMPPNLEGLTHIDILDTDPISVVNEKIIKAMNYCGKNYILDTYPGCVIDN